MQHDDNDEENDVNNDDTKENDVTKETDVREENRDPYCDVPTAQTQSPGPNSR